VLPERLERLERLVSPIPIRERSSTGVARIVATDSSRLDALLTENRYTGKTGKTGKTGGAGTSLFWPFLAVYRFPVLSPSDTDGQSLHSQRQARQSSQEEDPQVQACLTVDSSNLRLFSAPLFLLFLKFLDVAVSLACA